MLFYHPVLDELRYNDARGDQNFRETCCNPLLENQYCDMFFARRMINNCDNYKPPVLGTYRTYNYVMIIVVYTNIAIVLLAHNNIIESNVINNLSLPAEGVGDPHYRTFDRRYHTFNGDGDFTTLEVLPVKPEVGNVPLFTLQGRLKIVSIWPRVTTHSELAFGEPTLAFHVRLYVHESE